MILIANWKMNPLTLRDAQRLFSAIARALRKIKKIELVICPPFVYLPFLSKSFLPKNFSLGAQDCFWEQKGAYTGEISPTMLKNLGCSYVIVGHSERRQFLRESDLIINKKLKAALDQKLIPILCIGETEKEKEQGLTKKVLKRQLQRSFDGIGKKYLKKVIIAYEPVWAIGTGNFCDFREAKKIRIFVKNLVDTKIIYGGSVSQENARDYIFKSGFDGLLIGSASLSVQEFISIVLTLSS